MNDVVRYQEANQLTAKDMRAHVNLVQEVMKAVMIGPCKDHPDGVHYGKIPGVDKPTLFKPGAEKLCAVFRIAPKYEVEDLSSKDPSGTGFVRYRVRCIGVHQTTGIVLGEGIGECSSLEEKYKWRKAYDTDFNHTPENRRRLKYGWDRTKRQEYEVKQVRVEPADIANTILKMASKRALVGMTITVTAAGDLFTQDIEDMPEGMAGGADGDGVVAGRAAVEQPQGKTEKKAEGAGAGADAKAEDRPLSEGERNFLKKKLDAAALTDVDLKTKFPCGLDGLKLSQFEAVKAWLANPTA